MRARFGASAPWRVGVEEELIVVDARTHALAHEGTSALAAMDVDAADGEAKPDTYAALVELAAPASETAGAGAAALSALRARLRATGATALGAGIHPDGAFGDVEHVPEARYAEIAAQLRGLLARTPTCALHVHVGMPDAEAAIRACNGLRAHLPLLQALAANSPFWFGRDSGLASARAQLFRAYPRAEIPRAFRDYADYEDTVAAVVAAGALPDYTFLWWDVRPHPRLGTVEVRAMDSQSALWSAAALAALVQALARAEAECEGPWAPREVLMEASFTAARDGLAALLPLGDRRAPVADVAAAALDLARPHARALGIEDELRGIARILAEGNGAGRQRAAFARGGMPAVLSLLVDETATPYP
ncbi:MAG: carboxylate-amine ligase [Solirubrobacteraceae bacterium]